MKSSFCCFLEVLFEMESCSHSLLGNEPNRRCCGYRYRLQHVFSKGLILLFIWNTVFWFSSPEPYLPLVKNHINETLEFRINIHNLGIASYLLYPLLGLIADAKFGRYKVITASLYFIFFVNALAVTAQILGLTYNKVQFFWALSALKIMLVLGFGGIHANLIPFIVDQLIGASGEQLSAAIHWFFWSLYTGLLANLILSCMGIEYGEKYVNIPFGVLQISLLLVMVVSSCLCRKHLNTQPIISNPIKLIVLVIRYAWKNKCPRNRSALTYIDEEHPSRIDFGKDKFGGPFTEEQVEDVKTALQLIILLPFMVVFGIAIEPISFINHIRRTASNSISTCLLGYNFAVYFTVVVAFVPIYHFVIYPLLYKHIPSMLRRTGLGIAISICSILAYIPLDVVGHHDKPSTMCIFNGSNLMYNQTTYTMENYKLNLSPVWVLLPQIILGIGDMLAYTGSLEFVCAQAPVSMRGLLIGLWFFFIGIIDLIGFNLHAFFQYIPALTSAKPSCGLYYYILKAFLYGLLLVLFIVLSRRYKFRERNRVVNIQFIAEEHYERYIDAEREYDEAQRARQGGSLTATTPLSTSSTSQYMSM